MIARLSTCNLKNRFACLGRPIYRSVSATGTSKMAESCRVLSIQSHVVSGYVGNKAAVFPMQVLGFDVDFINSVQFSNHTGYPNKLKGTVLSGSEVLALSTGLSDNYLLNYDYLLTGYIGSETFLNSVLEVLDSIQKANPSLKYVCDPVLGDHHQYYVPVALVDIFKAKLIPRAYMITPNQFEAELLTGMKIQCEEDAIKALIQLHSLGPQVVVLTSAEFASTAVPDSTSLHCYILYPDTDISTDTHAVGVHSSSSSCGSSDVCGGGGNSQSNIDSGTGASGTSSVPLMVTKIEVNKIAGNYTGTGDALAALLLAWTQLLQQPRSDANTDGSTSIRNGNSSSSGGARLGGNPYSGALCNALATVKAMISRSSERVRLHNEQLNTTSTSAGTGGASEGSASTKGDESNRQHCALVRARELAVVQSKRDIETPPVDKLDCVSHRTWRVNRVSRVATPTDM